MRPGRSSARETAKTSLAVIKRAIVSGPEMIAVLTTSDFMDWIIFDERMTAYYKSA